MDPQAALDLIRSESASYADRLDAKDALCDWLDGGGFAPKSQPWLTTSADVRALWRGLGVRRPKDAHAL